MNMVGKGRVVSGPPGIDCGYLANGAPTNGACGHIFPIEGVTLFATPVAGWAFKEWRKGFTFSTLWGTNPSLYVGASGQSKVTVVFAPLLTVTAGEGGSVSSDPPGIACPPTCSVLFPIGTPVRLFTVPASGWRTSAWTGACEGTPGAADCLVKLSAPVTAGAAFSQTGGAAVRWDFNGDGATDLVWRNAATGENLIWLMDGNGSALVGTAVLPPLADLAWQIRAVADINGDGKPDLVWRNATTGENMVWFMDGTVRTGTASLPPVADTRWVLAGAADFNDDGTPDLLWRRPTTRDLVVWYMSGTSVIGADALPALADSNWAVADAVDYDGDGKADLIWRNPVTGAVVVWYMSGSTLLGSAYLPSRPDPNWSIAGVVDLGTPALLWRNRWTGANEVWLMNGTAQQAARALPAVGDPNWHILHEPDARGRIDVNADTRADLVWRNVATGQNAVWFMDGATLLGSDVLPAVTDTDWEIQAVEHVDNDGRPDILWRHKPDGYLLVWFMDGLRWLRSQSPPFGTSPSVATNFQEFALGDFNGDGKPDLVFRDPGGARTTMWLLDGSSITNSVIIIGETVGWDLVAAADFNADGRADLLWRNPATGQLKVWYMNGMSSIGTASIAAPADVNWVVAAARDMNGDGRPDLIWRHATTGANVIWFMNGATMTSYGMMPAVPDPNWVIVK